MQDLTFDSLVYAALPARPQYKHPTLAETTIVLRSLNQMGSTFPWPLQLITNAELATTETGKYLDALLHMQTGTEKRRQQSKADALTHLGQCGYMIAAGLLRTGVPAESTILLTQLQAAQSHMHAYGVLLYSLACVIKASYPPEASEETATKHLLYSWSAWCFLVRWHRNTTAAELLLATAKRFEHKAK